ncbi:Imm50 family immunity protein [Hymenobacter cheonanensis]|uniref:Imm50 family immunity protein n=1 Tax=Hymenobacter sp. CA2-7 TaxID=3063993 RepID=UPI00350EFB8E
MWQEKVMNPQLIKSLFKDDYLSLERIKVSDIRFVIRGTLICILNYDLENYLTSPPAKWVAKGYNTVQMQLSLIQATVSIAELSGSSAAGTLSIECVEDGFDVAYVNHENDNKLVLHCSWIHVDKVEGYAQSI